MSRSQALRKTTQRLLLLLGASILVGVVSVGSASAADCDPAVDAECTVVVIPEPPQPTFGYSVVYIDDRQFNSLLFLNALTAGLALATFVWRASGPLDLLGSKRW